MYIGQRIHVKYPLFSPGINETWIFTTDFLKNSEISVVMKFRPVGAESFHADRQTRDEVRKLSEFCERT